MHTNIYKQNQKQWKNVFRYKWLLLRGTKPRKENELQKSETPL